VRFVPNLYATYANSENALGRFMAFAGGKTSLNNKEKEVVNLVVSQINDCKYCLAAHTAGGKINGFSDEQLIDNRKGNAIFDRKLHALAQLVKNITENRGEIRQEVQTSFFDAGYNKGNLVDIIVAIGEKTTTNLLHKVTDVPLDFPGAPELG
jgi:AhpD family alkylhydroperoxidase